MSEAINVSIGMNARLHDSGYIVVQYALRYKYNNHGGSTETD
jgi:hypothetical protein